MGVRGPPPAVSERWPELLDDAEGIAAEYEDEGWQTVVVPTGDVTPMTGDPFGFNVLAPGDVFRTLQDLVEEVTFHSSHVYRHEEGGARFYIVVVEGTSGGVDEDGASDGGDAEGDVAVVVPTYLTVDAASMLQEPAEAAGAMYTHVRPLSNDERVTFSHDDPDLFF